MKNNKFNKLFYLFSKEYRKNQILKNALAKQSLFLKQNLHYNNIDTKIKVIHLKNNQMINDHLIELNSLDYKIAYFINAKFKFDTLDFKMHFDIVIVSLDWQIVNLLPNYSPNKVLPEFNKLSHIFVLAPNSINALDLKINNTLSVIKKI